MAAVITPILGAINTLVTGENMDGSKANGFDYAAAPLQILASLPMEGKGGGGGRVKLPNDALVVRGGMNTPENIALGIGTHPEGVTGFSVNCGTCGIEELAQGIKHGQVGTTTVAQVRSAGGDVIQTSGASRFHATVTNLPPEIASKLLNPVFKNPTKK